MSTKRGPKRISVRSAFPRSLLEVPATDLRLILDRAAKVKANRRKGTSPPARPLAGKVLAMIFDKPSTRTRVSFDIAMRQLGGETIMLTGQEMQLGRGETIADTARVLSRFVDLIVIRILDHDAMLELARHAAVPVINGLTKRSHPCQVMADILTFEEKKGPIQGRTVAWSGDANNVLASWVHAAQQFDFSLHVATPSGLEPEAGLLDWARRSGTSLKLIRDPHEAVQGADAVVSDCWVSMGDADKSFRHKLLAPYHQRETHGGRQQRRDLHALPARPSRRGGDQRRH